ncbi:DUF4235 domain-containing protein [Oerskovia flava]|uniref:DUF4235 domain-containing protein n=1 Tax=Oerskovia flava TaxID=2986422 RepID=UPI002240ABD8|nr:DUF4235 domain-containing protein [Oerskovia sp. JB1-3-2]
MEDNDQSLAVKVGTVALTFAAGWVAQKIVTEVWRRASGHDAPKDLDDPEVGIAAAVTFAAVTAAAAVVARRFASRGAQRAVTRFASRAV